MATYIRLTHFKRSDEKKIIDTFEEIGGEVVQSVAFVLEKGE